jgi:hypothetical protein
MTKEDKVRLQFIPPQPNDLLKLGEDGETIKAGETFEVSEADAEEMLTNPGTADQVRKSGSSVDPRRKQDEDETSAAASIAEAAAAEDSASQSPPSGGTAANKST